MKFAATRRDVIAAAAAAPVAMSLASCSSTPAMVAA
jgi:hypothetical protein